MSASDLKSQISNPESNFAIIVAGGSGTRMQSALPKQFLLLNGLPVLMHTLQAFHSAESKPQLILVLHPDYHNHWLELCNKHNFTIPHQLIKGGKTRFHSVKNGLNIIDNKNTVIAIQDAVRPLTSGSIIDNSFNYATTYGNAITAVKSRDSIRQMQGNHTVNLLREHIYLIQTPQTFRFEILKKAYDQPFDPKFTDDASVVESSGEKIHLIDGNYENIKLTFPEDIAIAEALLNKKPFA
ncbi:2-C-methyl-D-erythritol 4-phosphate cytidylyltransferase [Mucilaginibacter sp.]